MNIKSTLVFLTVLNLATLLVTCQVQDNGDEPPRAKLVKIGLNYALFNVTSEATFDKLPVESIGAIVVQGQSNNSFHQISTLKPSPTISTVVNVTQLSPGTSYNVQFYAINTKKEHSKPSEAINILLPPQAPGFSLERPKSGSVSISWDASDWEQIDHFRLTVQKVKFDILSFHLTIS